MAATGSEYVVLGMLLSSQRDGVPNAASHCLNRASSSDQEVVGGFSRAVCARLLGALRISEEKLASLPSRTEHLFGLEWGVPILGMTVCSNSAYNPSARLAGYSGPVPGTHWVMPNVLCGKSAGTMNDRELQALVTAGVETFVCLQTSYLEYGCQNYPSTLSRLKLPANHRTLRFLHCPIPDFGILADGSMLALVSELIRCLTVDGSVIYIHCYGGHGRTGTVVVNLIQALCEHDVNAALVLLQARHRARGCFSCALNDGTLEDREQISQASRMEGVMSRRQKMMMHEDGTGLTQRVRTTTGRPIKGISRSYCMCGVYFYLKKQYDRFIQYTSI